MVRFLPIFAIAANVRRLSIIFSAFLTVACCATPVDTSIGVPDCVMPQNITEQVWNDLELMRDTLSSDSLLYEECIDRLEGRIRLHDENL